MVENRELEELRRKINLLDDRLNKTLKKRLDIVKGVGRLKKKNNMPIRNLEREEEIIQRAVKSNLPERFARKIYGIIFEDSVIMQKGV